MHLGIAFISVLVGAFICLPLFKYMYKAVSANAPEFDKGYKVVKNRDATDDFFYAHGSRDQTVNTFAAYNLVVLMLPLIPSCFVAVPVYFIFSWLYAAVST